MRTIFFDDSHHARGEFSLGAFVFFDDDPNAEIDQALAETGFIPGVDEYKSRQPHSSNPHWADLRKLLFRIARQGTIGLVVAPYTEQARFGLHALNGLAHIARENRIEHPIAVFLDQGLFRSQREFEEWRDQSDLPVGVVIAPECDSRIVRGIQVADLVAHTCATALLGRLGVSDKVLHDEEEGEYQLSFEMWARLRYNFFARELTDPELRDAAESGLVDSRHGLYVAPGCSAHLATVVEDRFARTWLGCIH